MPRSHRVLFALVTAVMVGSLVAAGPSGSVGGGDPFREVQWGLDQIRVDEAWEVTRGAGVTIAIVDGGVDHTHPELAGRMVPGNVFLQCGGYGCGDGHTTADWHGTHVAGIAAAAAGNGEGIAGVAPEARVMSVQVLSGGSGNLSDVVLAVRWAAERGADVINMSLGARPGTQLVDDLTNDQQWTRAVEYARSRGAVLVAAAGNDSVPLCSSPAWKDGIVCVAASGSDGLLAEYSNLPNDPELVAVTAPGGALRDLSCLVLSTVPAGHGIDDCGVAVGPSYRGAAGTSMASPHVAGVAALLRSVGCSVDVTTELLTSTARNPLTGARGAWDPLYGYGIVDAGAALAAAAGRCSGVPPADPPPPTAPACLQNTAHEIPVGVANEPVPDGWSVETAENADGTSTWEVELDAVAFESTIRTHALGLGRKDDRLVAPPFTATTSTSVRFAHEYLLEHGRDGGVLETSTDGGATWQPVPPQRILGLGYDATIAADADSAIAGRPAFTGRSQHHVWRRILPDVEVDLGHLAGQEVRFSWRLVQDGVTATSLPGEKWALHHVTVEKALAPGCGG